MPASLTELIARAPWREAVTFRDTWPHEYVLTEKDSQQELLDAVCERFRDGEGVACRFFSMINSYLFIGDHKYWLMAHWEELKPGVNYVLNRAQTLPGPPGLRHPAGRHRQSGGLPDHPGLVESERQERSRWLTMTP